ncbi:MAG: hypothetical protein ABI321_21440 [Polyangia bacterium]
MSDLSFVLVNDARYPEPTAVIAAADELGLVLKLSIEDAEPGMLTFDGEGEPFFVAMLMASQHPDALDMPVGPMSPSRDDIAGTKAHFILTAVGVEGDNAARDLVMAQFTAAIVKATSGVAAMLAHGVVWHRGELYHELVGVGATEGELPVEIAIDVTGASEDDDRCSFLTHNLARYDRQELYVTCSRHGTGAVGFVFDIARWMLAENPALPTGDTIGRTSDERLVVQRVPNPAGDGEEVIRVDLPERTPPSSRGAPS